MKTLNSYQIQVQGHFDNAFAEWFAPLSIANQPNGEATLTGPIRDQAVAIHYALSSDRIRCLIEQ
jgi:hypothetical protein